MCLEGESDTLATIPGLRLPILADRKANAKHDSSATSLSNSARTLANLWGEDESNIFCSTMNESRIERLLAHQSAPKTLRLSQVAGDNV